MGNPLMSPPLRSLFPPTAEAHLTSLRRRAESHSRGQCGEGFTRPEATSQSGRVRRGEVGERVINGCAIKATLSSPGSFATHQTASNLLPPCAQLCFVSSFQIPILVHPRFNFSTALLHFFLFPYSLLAGPPRPFVLSILSRSAFCRQCFLRCFFFFFVF